MARVRNASRYLPQCLRRVLPNHRQPCRAVAYHAMAHRDRDQIKGWNLGCWCEPGTPCHGDVLLCFARRSDHGRSDMSRPALGRQWSAPQGAVTRPRTPGS